MKELIIPAIVIVAYNRPRSLERLLTTIAKAEYSHPDISLIISIDYSINSEVIEIAQKFEWPFGAKTIISQKEHLGLKRHIYSCLSLTHKYGAIVLLEDDLVVSPYFFDFATKALSYYQDDPLISGVSLYSYHVKEANGMPFTPIDNGRDTFLMQLPSSWGLALTKSQWSEFEKQLDRPEINLKNVVPGYIRQWGNTSWKKDFAAFLISNDKYFVYPYLSLTSNFEDSGTHATTSDLFQVPIQAQKKEYDFGQASEELVKYDAWYEAHPELFNHFDSSLAAYQYEVNISGLKKNTNFDYILTSQLSDKQLLSWSDEMLPLEQNIIHSIKGKGLGLYKASDTFSNEIGRSYSKDLLHSLVQSVKNSFCIVISVPRFDAEELNRTLLSINSENYRNKRCIISCKAEDSQHCIELAAQIDEELNYNLTIKSQPGKGIFENIWITLKNSKEDYVFWINQGAAWEDPVLNQLNTIFIKFPFIHILSAIGDHRHLPLIRSRSRIFLEQLLTSLKTISSEGTVFSRSVIQQTEVTSSTATDEQYHLDFLCKTFTQGDAYSANIKLSGSKIIQFEKETANFIKTSYEIKIPYTLRMTLFLFRHFGKNRNKYIQGFFQLIFDLTPIIEYDHKHQTFYLSNY